MSMLVIKINEKRTFIIFTYYHINIIIELLIFNSFIILTWNPTFTYILLYICIFTFLKKKSS